MLLVHNIDHRGNDIMTLMLTWLMIVGSTANKVTQYIQTKSSSLPHVM